MQVKKISSIRSNDRGRMICTVTWSDGSVETTNLARALMQELLGRKLLDWEQVDHINGDKSDDRLENLQLLTGKKNYNKYLKQANKETKYIEIMCSYCFKNVEIPLREYRKRVKRLEQQGKLVFLYCSRSCSHHGRIRRT